jgi:hypoxanthine phosphoribosyltransferase
MADNISIKLLDKEFELFIRANTINAAVTSVANQLNTHYANKVPIFISVLNGSFMFTADLLRQFKHPCELAFVKVSSYSGLQSSGKVNDVLGLTKDIANRHVVILEDIVDTGNTIEFLENYFLKNNPASIKIAAMFFKPSVYKKARIIDYVGISIDNDFIVGYGLDYNEQGRTLPEVYKLKNK